LVVIENQPRSVRESRDRSFLPQAAQYQRAVNA
jgi:hypothetical protein